MFWGSSASECSRAELLCNLTPDIIWSWHACCLRETQCDFPARKRRNSSPDLELPLYFLKSTHINSQTDLLWQWRTTVRPWARKLQTLWLLDFKVKPSDFLVQIYFTFTFVCSFCGAGLHLADLKTDWNRPVLTFLLLRCIRLCVMSSTVVKWLSSPLVTGTDFPVLLLRFLAF